MLLWENTHLNLNQEEENAFFPVHHNFLFRANEPPKKASTVFLHCRH